MAQSAGVKAYTVSPLPSLASSDRDYMNRELGNIAASIRALNMLCPQAASKAPVAPLDGTPRLSRAPWRPLEGQTEDQWVYYDAASSSWKPFPG